MILPRAVLGFFILLVACSEREEATLKATFPRTLSEAVAKLDDLVSEQGLAFEEARTYLGTKPTGMQFRNSWIHRNGSELKKYFNDADIYVPDIMWMGILEAWEMSQSEELDERALLEEIWKREQELWKKSSETANSAINDPFEPVKNREQIDAPDPRPVIRSRRDP